MLKRHYLIIMVLLLLPIVDVSPVFAQESPVWPPQQRIPGYDNDTWPPILIADRNQTVHAFSYQWLGGEEGPDVRAIVYSQWTQNTGWTTPVDILLSPLKNDARLLDAFLDQSGIVHVIFWGGDNKGANIYYSQAPIAGAGNARAWSAPIQVAENAGDPENGVIYSDSQDNLIILFSGKSEGNGLYMTRSIDDGSSWSKPVLIFNTTDNINFIHNLKIYKSDTGWIHAIWNEVTPGGQGRGINYSKTRIDNFEWSVPVKLAEAATGYGTNTPAIIEYHSVVLAFYNLGGILQRSSDNGGQSWTSPRQLFAHHIGVNGALSLVLDGNDQLHIFFGQRIPGSPDIHGIWHSVYNGVDWSEPEAVVSGPQISAKEGDKAFDPFEARAVVSAGNVLLVTWRSDPGIKGNGVWYSDQVLDAPALPLAVPAGILPTTTPFHSPTETPSISSFTVKQDLEVTDSTPLGLTNSILNNNPGNLLLISIIPVILLIFVVFFFTFLAYRNHDLIFPFWRKHSALNTKQSSERTHDNID